MHSQTHLFLTSSHLEPSITSYPARGLRKWRTCGMASAKNRAPTCVATARANRVFPVPGGPYKRTPRGGRIPIRVKASAWRWGQTTASNTACFAGPVRIDSNTNIRRVESSNLNNPTVHAFNSTRNVLLFNGRKKNSRTESTNVAPSDSRCRVGRVRQPACVREQTPDF